MWPFKKIKRCKHLKNFGDKWPTNMEEIVRFSPHEKDTIGYGVHQCNECGKRSFSCIGLHMMGPQAEKTIDSFIAYKITLEQFEEFLKENMAWFRITKTGEKDD